MSNEFKDLTDEFDNFYTTEDKTLQASENFDAEDGSSGQYETFGADLEYVRKFPNQKRVWTVVDGDTDDNMYIVSGMHYVNRVCYVISDQEVLPKHENESLYWCKFAPETNEE